MDKIVAAVIASIVTIVVVAAVTVGVLWYLKPKSTLSSNNALYDMMSKMDTTLYDQLTAEPQYDEKGNVIQTEIPDYVQPDIEFSYRVYIKNWGWLDWVRSDSTTGKLTANIEGLQFKYTGPGELKARAYYQDEWHDWVSAEQNVGDPGKAIPLRAMQFQIFNLPSQYKTSIYFAGAFTADNSIWRTNIGFNQTIGHTTSDNLLYFVRLYCGDTENTEIGRFDKYIGRPFRLITRAGSSTHCLYTDGHHEDGKTGLPILYKTPDNSADVPERNRIIWTVDREGHLMPYRGQDHYLWCPTVANAMRNDMSPKLIFDKTNWDSTAAKWYLDGSGGIHVQQDPTFVLGIYEGATKYATNGQNIYLYRDAANLYEQWKLQVVDDNNENIVEEYYRIRKSNRRSGGRYKRLRKYMEHFRGSRNLEQFKTPASARSQTKFADDLTDEQIGAPIDPINTDVQSFDEKSANTYEHNDESVNESTDISADETLAESVDKSETYRPRYNKTAMFRQTRQRSRSKSKFAPYDDHSAASTKSLSRTSTSSIQKEQYRYMYKNFV